ncbi:DNA-binding transcriptional LysR family regulator [Phyllobacterium myrsinacearum]|uniref:LysR family transcriptional regulator n=1 Tax=Phyllobacterium myrsinacearum TaxID=28101 RepID=UPI00102A70E3|nr:LysR family transcriptional regulator [Phyllobacterium myrsinacearum]RZS76794.1 DNA-binding transcriptional LysR family regulator [Phyllobacterium myrsinacearum]
MFEELRTLVLFAQEGSVQKVAKRLPLTQPAVSRQIQRLEQALGVQLLDRRQKPPILTPMGSEVLARSRDILDAVEKLRAIANIPEPEGVFRLGIVNGLAHDRFADSIIAVIAQFPRISLRLKSGWSHELAEQHRLGNLDVTIILSDASRFYDAERIGEEEVIVVGACTPDSSHNNQQTSWILSPEPCDVRRSLSSRLAQKNCPLVVAAEIEHSGLQMELVRQGIGLGLMPKRLFDRFPPDGIMEVDAVGGSLRLDVLMFRSPHLGPMAKVADAIGAQIRAFIAR